MIQLEWAQLAGAVAGGLVGGFSGFVANSVLMRAQGRSHARNVGSALVGEISALCRHIEATYLARLSEELSASGDARMSLFGVHSFRGERDYMPIFHSLGIDIGSLPGALACDLVSWYTGLAVCLERARYLHELAMRRDPDPVDYTTEIVQLQRAAFADLMRAAPMLLERLSRL